MDYCDHCNKKYKNTASLKTHAYRYHPYSNKAENEKDKSCHCQLVELDGHLQIARNKIDIILLNNNLERLEKSVVDIRSRLPDYTHQIDGVYTDKNCMEEVTVQDQNRTNNVEMTTVENKSEESIGR